MPQRSTKHKNALQPSENVAPEPPTGKATGWTMPKARSTTMPQKSTKHKDAPRPPLEVARDPKTRGLRRVRPKARSKTMPPESTQHKDTPRPPKEVARDAKPGKTVPVRPKARSTTMPPKSKEKKDLMESLKPALDYITMRSKSYDKSRGRATRRSRADITTEGSDVEEAADDGGAAGREDTDDGDTDDGDTDDGDTHDEDTDDGDTDDGDTDDGDTDDEDTDDGDTDDGDTDDEDTDDEDAVGVQTGGRGPAEMEADGGRDGGPHAGYRIYVEGEVTEAHAARVEADRRDDARGYAAGREAPTRDLSGRELVRRNPDRAGPYDARGHAAGTHAAGVEADRRDDARGYATRREAPIRDPSERHLGGRELVRRDPSRTHPHPGAPRRVPDDSILDHMPPLETGDDFEVIEDVSKRIARELIRREREQCGRKHLALARQHRGGQHHGGQGYQGQGHQGQAHSRQVGQGRAGQNDTTTRVVRSRHDPRDDPPPAYTPYDQRDIGPNGCY